MPESVESTAAQHLVQDIRDAFPEDAAHVDAILVKDGFLVEEVPYIWVEHFSQQTTDALKGGNTSKVKMHLELLSRLLSVADEPTIRCIDVAYVEPLMWDVKDEKLKREWWRLMPASLRSLYVAMWGKRSFMR